MLNRELESLWKKEFVCLFKACLITGHLTGLMTGHLAGLVTGHLAGLMTGHLAGLVTEHLAGLVTGHLADLVTGHLAGLVTGQWLCGLRRGSAAACLLGLRVRIPSRACMSVSFECCVLPGRGLCDELITRPEEFYRMCV
jgi:hypothetical protein